MLLQKIKGPVFMRIQRITQQINQLLKGHGDDVFSEIVHSPTNDTRYISVTMSIVEWIHLLTQR